MRKRSLGRELALKYLYTREVSNLDEASDFELFAFDQETNVEARDFARSLVLGVMERREELRAEIERRAIDWPWRRMPVIDRSLLLIGAHEIVDRPEIPASVTIDEVVELAKRYSTASSGAFVNGVLDALARAVRTGGIAGD